MLANIEAVLGPDPSKGDKSEVICLNRIFRWCKATDSTPECIEIEPDPRHVEILLHNQGLDKSNSKGVTTPGIRDGATEVGPELPTEACTPFRSDTMRANFLAQDRPDLKFAAKEIARHMSSPNQTGLAALKRCVRYLKDHQRLVRRLVRQRLPTNLHIYSDTNHAGCLRTRKTTG